MYNLNRKLGLLFLFFITTLCLKGFPEDIIVGRLEVDEATVLPVSFLELITVPERFNGKFVRVECELEAFPDSSDFIIFAHRLEWMSDSNKILIGPFGKNENGWYDDIYKISGRRVLVFGKFEYDKNKNGWVFLRKIHIQKIIAKAAWLSEREFNEWQEKQLLDAKKSRIEPK